MTEITNESAADLQELLASMTQDEFADLLRLAVGMTGAEGVSLTRRVIITESGEIKTPYVINVSFPAEPVTALPPLEEWHDISSEVSRCYHFPDGSRVTIELPLRLHVSESGGHRVYEADGTSNYVQTGWHLLTWQTKPGMHPFSF